MIVNYDEDENVVVEDFGKEESEQAEWDESDLD